MNVHQLRRWSDKVDTAMVRRWSDKAQDGLKVTGKAAKNGASTVYTTAMNSPKATTAVVLGAGVAAAVLWLVNRNGTYSSRRKQALTRVRRTPTRSRRARAAA
jgi:hypothetical protein